MMTGSTSELNEQLERVIAERDALREALEDACRVNENGVARVRSFLRTAGHIVDPIVVSSAIGLYLATVSRERLGDS